MAIFTLDVFKFVIVISNTYPVNVSLPEKDTLKLIYQIIKKKYKFYFIIQLNSYAQMQERLHQQLLLYSPFLIC